MVPKTGKLRFQDLKYDAQRLKRAELGLEPPLSDSPPVHSILPPSSKALPHPCLPGCPLKAPMSPGECPGCLFELTFNWIQRRIQWSASVGKTNPPRMLGPALSIDSPMPVQKGRERRLAPLTTDNLPSPTPLTLIISISTHKSPASRRYHSHFTVGNTEVSCFKAIQLRKPQYRLKRRLRGTKEGRKIQSGSNPKPVPGQGGPPLQD